MNTTYKVVAQNCDTPRITVEVEGNRFAAAEYAFLLRKAFRQVDVLNNETGEVMMNFYVSDEWFAAILSEAECIALLQEKINENRAR